MAAQNGCSVLNLNVGILGHVDSGKTSLSKSLSTVASTASFDKNPQSKERGITLDLGFSSFLVDFPTHLQNEDSTYKQLQFTLVDCPGHASLIKTIIGGAQIIDMMVLVVDIVKGMQTQTAECLIIGEILCEKMLVVLNKVDLIPEKKRNATIEKMKKRMLKTLESTKFKNSPIIAVAAKIGGAEILRSETFNLDELISCLQQNAYVPTRNNDGPFLFSVDHCFSIRGQGTVMTGTVLNGSVTINDVIEIPTMKETKKVKSMQMFRQPVKKANQGDRVGICVTQFDPKKMERGVICCPGYLPSIHGAILNVNRIPYFKGGCTNKSKFHITVGHETVMARLQFFGPPADSDVGKKFESGLDLDIEYEHDEGMRDSHDARLQYVILEFDKPIHCPKDSLIIASKLDLDINVNTCRLAFHGRMVRAFLSKDYKTDFLPLLKVFKVKRKHGMVERMADDYSVIVRSLFKRETALGLFANMTVRLGSGEEGRIEGGFGQSGKIKVRVPQGLSDDTKTKLSSMRKKKGKKNEEDRPSDEVEPIEVFLEFKKYIYDREHKMVQS